MLKLKAHPLIDFIRSQEVVYLLERCQEQRFSCARVTDADFVVRNTNEGAFSCYPFLAPALY